MRMTRPFLLLICLWSGGSALATELFLLNKTGRPLYYKLNYFTFEQALLRFTPPITKKISKWLDKNLQDKVSEGWIVKDGIVHVKSYRLNFLRLQKDKDGESLIISFAGDKRIRDMCQTKKIKDCLGSMLRGLDATISRGMLGLYQPFVKYYPMRPVALVVTLDPIKKKRGKTGYILTELAHTWGPFGQPKPFFYELQGMETPK